MHKHLLTLIALLALGVLLAGCESDSTAPDEDLPGLNNEDVATQSGAMASAMTEVFPRIWNPQSSGKDNGEYEFTWVTGPVIGSVYSEFRTAEGGDLVDYDQAAWGRVYTEDGAPLAITLVDGGIPWLLGFDITADIDQGGGTATANGGGSLVVGDYMAEFTIIGVVVESDGDYPAAGVIEFTNEGVTATVTFDGDNMVTVTSGGETWTVDLEDGTIS
ncbi:hypothetical protein GF314_08725 [bacterium]|nr:hypothetical protein [bacterium]